MEEGLTPSHSLTTGQSACGYMPILTTAPIGLQNGNDPSVAQATGQIDLALLASEYYGKNIRQGQKFTVKAVSAHLVPANLDAVAGIDIGISAVASLNHIPAMRHSRKAWNNVFNQWSSQKRLSGKVGANIRNDDLEFCWNIATKNSRSSTIYGTGIGDVTTETLCLRGDSSATNDIFSLEDYYNSSFPAPSASRDHFSNSVIKDDKFGGTPFPAVQKTLVSATNSAQVDYETLGNEQDGAVAQDGFIELISPHQVLCGLYYYDVKVMPDDTATQVEEDFSIVFSFHVVRFTPLVFSRKTSSRRTMKKGAKRNSGKQSSKRGRRR